jgi:hypothetical protein
MTMDLNRRTLVTGAPAGALAGCGPSTIGAAMNIFDGVTTRAPEGIVRGGKTVVGPNHMKSESILGKSSHALN